LTARRIAIGFVALLLALAIWSFGIEPRWTARRDVEAPVPGWVGARPLRVAVAGDWHFSRRPWWRVTTVARARGIVDAINAAQPDLVLLPGDFIADRDYQPATGATAVDEIASELARLKAPLGVVAVLGNHDWWHDGPAFAAALRKQGITVLENQSQAPRPDSMRCCSTATACWWTARASPTACCATCWRSWAGS
jgi:predicted MPP superfamily phosphohydrolase